ncbi:MAG: PEF-CTERM sorting domain-containing protein [Methanophagales archaeon]|nr:PEF-CTERM sorting domain-containing protein [Methanophagales archaeon]
MKKAKVITALALTVVMLAAMTGLTLAWGGQIGATDSGGTTKTLFIEGDEVYATGAVINPVTYVNVYVTEDEEWTDGDDITTKSVLITLTDVTPAQIASTIYLGDVSNDGEPSDIPFPGAYDIMVDVDQDGVYDPVEDGVEDFVNDAPFGCKAFTTEVPEFATIALPVVSVLGLLLFFNRRKHKKE